MSEGAPSALADWSNFYVITGSSAAALTGLLFVVITLVAGDRQRATSEGIGTFTTPTIVHFCVALFVSLTLNAPWRSLVHVALMLGLAGAYGAAYVSIVTSRAARLTAYRPKLDDWLWYALLPFAGYAAVLAAAIALPQAPAPALFTAAGVTVLLIFVGIHNAWDVVTYIVVERIGADAHGDGESPHDRR